jgi:hypothetical protein
LNDIAAAAANAPSLEAGDVGQSVSRFSHENHAANSALVAAIGELAATQGATPHRSRALAQPPIEGFWPLRRAYPRP